MAFCRKSFIYIIFLTLLIPSFSFSSVDAYVETIGNVIDTSVQDNLLTLTIDNGTEPNDDRLKLQVLDSDIVQVNYLPNGETETPDTPMIDPNKSWTYNSATINTSSDPITITTEDMLVEISKNPARMTIKKADGTKLLWEPNSGGVFYDGIRFEHNNTDSIYGIRSFNAFEDAGGLLRNNNEHPAHAGQQGDSGGPFIWSTKGYGVLVDSDGGYPYTDETNGKLEFYYGGTPAEGRRYTKKDIQYYVMVGNPENIMESFTDITGEHPMMPKWSLGFSNFEWNTNQTELKNIVETYRAKDIPIDSYGLDYDWKRYGEDNYGSFKWNTDNFPDASTSALKDYMDSKGIKMIGITKPRIVNQDTNGNRTVQYQDATNNGYYYPGHEEYQDYFIPVLVQSIDPYKAQVRDWLWQNSIEAFDKGISGWWNDETDKVSSNGAEYWFGNFTTTHLSQALYEGQRSYTNNSKRVWQTARTFYPGAQRYATTLWSGDIGSQFNKGEKINWAAGMQEQRSVMLSSINNGQPKWGMDIGGFNQQDGTTSNPSPELYTRWMQFGAFTPVFRVHGNNYHQRQPWFYGQTAEEVSKGIIRLRYSLLPYMYSYERKAYETGTGLVRPLMQVYPNEGNVKDYTDGWMFGDYLYVSPVLESSVNSSDIYLPPGTWIDYFRGIEYNGNQTIHYEIDDDTWTDVPLFIKKGAIIPSQSPQDYVDQENTKEIYLDIFPDTILNDFTYYDDDSSTYDYENGEYLEQIISAQILDTDSTQITLNAKTGSYDSELSHYILKVHGKAGSTVEVDGQNLTQQNNLASLLSSQDEGWTKGTDIYGDVTYIKVNALQLSDVTININGNETINQSHMTYQMEEGSLSGVSESTQASKNTNHLNYKGTGFVDGYHNIGAETTIYPKVKVSGDFNSSLRYSNGTGNDQTLSVFLNGKYYKKVTFPPTASWDDWSTLDIELPLTAGYNIVSVERFEDTNDTGNVNLDEWNIDFDPLTAVYEAETANLSGGAKVNQNHWFYKGTGFVDTFTSEGAEATFNVFAEQAGAYDIELRYANGTQTTQALSTFVNGSYVSQISLNSIGDNWNEWLTNSQTVNLQEGLNTITISYESGDTGNVNLDRLLVTSQNDFDALYDNNLLDNGSFERELTFSDNWTEWHPSDQDVAFGVDSGNSINPPESAIHADKRAYFYSSNAYKQSIHQLISVPTNNASYRFEAWVRLKNTAPTTARAEITQYGGQDQFIDLQTNGKWTYISIDDVYVTNGQIDIGFYVDSSGGTVLHIDDVRVVKN